MENGRLFYLTLSGFWGDVAFLPCISCMAIQIEAFQALLNGKILLGLEDLVFGNVFFKNNISVKY